MKCKKCKAELEAGCQNCPECGARILTPEEKKTKRWRIAFIISACFVGLLLLALLAGVINYGITGSFLPKENDIFYQNSYSFSQEELNTAKGNKTFLSKMDKVVATMGEHKLTNRMLQLYYWGKVASTQYADVDLAKPLDEQIQNPETGMTWQQFFLEKALEAWQQDMTLVDQAKKAGFKMPAELEEQYKTFETDLDSYAQYSGFINATAMLQSLYGPGCTYQIYYDYLWNREYGAQYMQKMIKDTQVTDAEVEQFFREHEEVLKTGETAITKDSGKLVDVRHILIMPEGGSTDENGNTTYSAEAWEACRKRAQGLLDQFLAGDQSETSFSDMAKKNTADTYSKANGGLYEYIAKGDMVKAFEDWSFDDSRQRGDTGLIKTDSGYHIMYFIAGDEGWIRVSTDGVKMQKCDDTLKAWVDAQEVEINFRAIVLAEVDLSAYQ